MSVNSACPVLFVIHCNPRQLCRGQVGLPRFMEKFSEWSRNRHERFAQKIVWSEMKKREFCLYREIEFLILVTKELKRKVSTIGPWSMMRQPRESAGGKYCQLRSVISVTLLRFLVQVGLQSLLEYLRIRLSWYMFCDVLWKKRWL